MNYDANYAEKNLKNFFFKPSKIIGHKLSFVNATMIDAEFILTLRLSQEAKFLSATSERIEEQKKWLASYDNDSSQVYFIIKDDADNNVGTVRMYDQQDDSFCWGSWIIKNDAPFYYAIESALMVYQFALSLRFKNSHFDVRKQNKSVWQFHEKFGAKRIDETELDYFYQLDYQNIMASLAKYKKYLPNSITILS